MHWLLEKQLRLSGLSEDDIPDQLSDVFSHIGRTYGQVDQERHLLGMLLTGASDDLLNMYTVLQDVEGRPSWIDGWTRRIAEQLHDMSGAVTPVEPDAREKANTYAWSLLADLERPLTTPATDILGFASILQEEGTDEVKEYAHIIHYSAGRMLELVKSVIDLALLETDRLGGDDELLDVTDYLQQTVRTLDPVLQRRGLELAVVPTHAPVRVRLERGYLSRLLRNFTNALMHVYRLDGRLPLEVRMSGDTVEVRAVGDEGSLNLDRWRAWEEGDDEQLPPELRLGLTLVQRMAHPAGGAIDVVREGDDVILRLALPAVEDGPTPEIVTQPEEPAAPEKLRLLVIDDDLETQILMLHLLKKQFNVDVADNAGAAIDLARDEKYDVVLMDIKLGEHSGIDVMQTLRHIDHYERIPIVALTAHALPGDRERFLADGFDEYISKPFTRQTVIDAIKRLGDQ